MKNRLFILVVLFMLVGVSSVSAQIPELTYMEDSFIWDSGSSANWKWSCYRYTIYADVDFGGLINITELMQSEMKVSKVRVLLMDEYNFISFVNSHGRSYDAVFEIDVVEDNGTVFWDSTYMANNETIVHFVYWYMEPEVQNVRQIEIRIEMWDYEYYQPPAISTTITTNTTTTTTTTTTTSGTTTTTDRIENNLLIYLLLGVLGGIGAIIIYMVVRPRKVKYVWDVK